MVIAEKSSRSSGSRRVGGGNKNTSATAAAAKAATGIAKKLTAMQGVQQGVLEGLKSQLAHLPREVLRQYLQRLTPAPSGLQELEHQSLMAVTKLNKSMKRCKRRLGSLLNETTQQLQSSACPRARPRLQPPHPRSCACAAVSISVCLGVARAYFLFSPLLYP